MKKYRHIFFDLDGTLWDFQKNAEEALTELFSIHDLHVLGIESPSIFIDVYKKKNEVLWKKYRNGTVDKMKLRTQRFEHTLGHFGITNEELVFKLDRDYIKISPMKTNLIDYAVEILTYLNKKYTLHIITNGFQEVQFSKLLANHLLQYFKQVITSEKAGIQKPDKKIFEYSVSKARAEFDESIYIGDSWEVDIMGAKNAGMDQVYFNPEKKKNIIDATYEISSLRELEKLF
ncbi:MAG: noncanonical pyrimidine nucleotidase, YjjG family [Bacteroidetes bacterium]|nr:noncanonical pyrimidine nucleotidase, YjjG family [Bacteroidota bacterium]